MDPSTLFLDVRDAFTMPKTGVLTPHAWKFLTDIQAGLTTVDLTSQVTGVLPFANGGTSHANLQFTTSGATNVTLPASGSLVALQGASFKAQTVTTGSVVAGTSSLVTVTWGSAFADANYTAVASVLDGTAAIASLSVVHVEVKTNTQVKVRVQNTAAGDLTGTLQVIGVHD